MTDRHPCVPRVLASRCDTSGGAAHSQTSPLVRPGGSAGFNPAPCSPSEFRCHHAQLSRTHAPSQRNGRAIVELLHHKRLYGEWCQVDHHSPGEDSHAQAAPSGSHRRERAMSIGGCGAGAAEAAGSHAASHALAGGTTQWSAARVLWCCWPDIPTHDAWRGRPTDEATEPSGLT